MKAMDNENLKPVGNTTASSIPHNDEIETFYDDDDQIETSWQVKNETSEQLKFETSEVETSQGIIEHETSLDRVELETSLPYTTENETSENETSPGNIESETSPGNANDETSLVFSSHALPTGPEPGEKAVAKKRKKPYFLQPDTKPGDNARYIRMARVAMNLPPIDISDPKQVEQRINDYFDYCEQNDAKPSLVGLTNWLGINKDTLQTWKTGECRSATHTDVIKKAYDALEGIWVDYMQNGKINPAAGIFLGKNFYGYRDEQKITIRPDAGVATGDPDATRSKYLTDGE